MNLFRELAMVRRLFTKVGNSLRNQGVVGTLQQAGNSICKRVLEQAPSRRRARRLKAEQDSAFDKRFNVETAGDHPVWHKSETDVLPGRHD